MDLVFKAAVRMARAVIQLRYEIKPISFGLLMVVSLLSTIDFQKGMRR
jgi:hypothetical protein